MRRYLDKAAAAGRSQVAAIGVAQEPSSPRRGRLRSGRHHGGNQAPDDARRRLLRHTGQGNAPGSFEEAVPARTQNLTAAGPLNRAGRIPLRRRAARRRHEGRHRARQRQRVGEPVYRVRGLASRAVHSHVTCVRRRELPHRAANPVPGERNTGQRVVTVLAGRPPSISQEVPHRQGLRGGNALLQAWRRRRREAIRASRDQESDLNPQVASGRRGQMRRYVDQMRDRGRGHPVDRTRLRLA